MSNEIDMPLGLMFSISLNENALKYYAKLDDNQKMQINNFIQCSTSGNDCKERISSIVNCLENNNLNFK